MYLKRRQTALHHLTKIDWNAQPNNEKLLERVLNEALKQVWNVNEIVTFLLHADTAKLFDKIPPSIEKILTKKLESFFQKYKKPKRDNTSLTEMSINGKFSVVNNPGWIKNPKILNSKSMAVVIRLFNENDLNFFFTQQTCQIFFEKALEEENFRCHEKTVVDRQM